MPEPQLFLKSSGVGRPRDDRIKHAVLEAMRRLKSNAAPETVSREVVLSLHRKVHWTTAQRYLDELATERLVVKRTLKQGKKTFFYYNLA